MLKMPKTGLAPSEAEDKDLAYWGKRLAEELEKDPNKRFADRDRELLAAIRGEQARRGNGAARSAAAPRPAAAAPPQTQAIQRAPQTQGLSLEKLTHEPAAITARLRELSGSYHLVTPTTQVEALPIGFGVAISLVNVNPDTSKSGPGDVYSVGGGKVGLAGTKILEIAGAAGVDWDPRECGRLDNGSNPHYCHFRAVGYVKNLDGSERRLIGEVEIDAREGSPQIDEIVSKAREANPPRDPSIQIRELRKFLLRHAETKAKLRAIASMGIKRSYNPSELSKPFAVARLMFTGRTEDPNLREKFALMNAEHAIKGRSALYGGAPPALSQRPAPEFRGHEPPPPGSVDEDYNDLGGYDYDTDGEEKPPSEPKASAEPVGEPVGDDARGGY